ncbi:MAG: hypothetical protein SVY10_08430 [Thermodesulfobacteriota bacterium]|nr:hypothetical protein [Thermodesulfobacteriota bacterium]
MLKRIVIPFVLLILFIGCEESTLNIKVRYDQIHGLKENDRVIFEKNHIGSVTSISYTSGGYYTVGLAIKEDFSNAATENSQFFITRDFRNTERKAIEIVQSPKGGVPLEEGIIVGGSHGQSTFFSEIGKDLEKGLDDLKKHFETFFKELKKIPESDEVKKLEKELEHLAEEMKRSGESVRKKIEKDVLPKLRQEIEKLRKRLHELGREDEIERLDHQMEKIREI